MADLLAIREDMYRKRIAHMQRAGIRIPKQDMELWFEWVRFLHNRLPAVASADRPDWAEYEHKDAFAGAVRDFVNDHPMLPIVQDRLMRAEQLYDLLVNLPRAAILN